MKDSGNINGRPTRLLRAAEVRLRTGWGTHYLSKLRKMGVLHTWQPSARSWPWYYEEEILAVLNREITQKA